jgi:signal peptidase I
MGVRRRAQSRSAWRRLDGVLIVVVLALGALAGAAVISGQYQVRPVLSGSMRPGLPVGGIVVTERVPMSAVQVRDVVVFHQPDHPEELVVHRIISLTPGASGPAVQTQGDANTAPDPWTVTLRGATAYRAAFSVPLVGYVAVWAHGATVSRLLVGVGLLLVAGAAAGALLHWRRSARGTTRRADAPAPDAPAPPPPAATPASEPPEEGSTGSEEVTAAIVA